MERQLAKSDQSTDSVTGMIVGIGYIQCTRGSYQGGDFEENFDLAGFLSFRRGTRGQKVMLRVLLVVRSIG